MDCAVGVVSKLCRARTVRARVGDTGSPHPATKREAARKATMCLMRQLRGGRRRASLPAAPSQRRRALQAPACKTFRTAPRRARTRPYHHVRVLRTEGLKLVQGRVTVIHTMLT